ncbi:MAG: anhydro-N-acetylmuramic acid kinase [Deltaproteobacteria bacterium]
MTGSKTAMARLRQLSEREDRICLGLSSGTSADGVDVALVRIVGSGPGTRVTLLSHATYPFPDRLRHSLHALSGIKELCELNFSLGEAFAEAAFRLVRLAEIEMTDVNLIGSHGQTVYHLPPYLAGVPSTLQIGEGAVIAERTGVITVSDFRVRDVAAGGHGAPLVPYVDGLLFRHPTRTRALQNIGGIANVTIVGGPLAAPIAFDTGPGNMLLDQLAPLASGGRLRIDEDGELSGQGQVIPELLRELLAHPYLSLPPPKSAGRELFGEGLCHSLWERFRDRPFDLLATAAAFTAESIHDAYRRFVEPTSPVDEIYLSGGGAANETIVKALERLLSPLPVRALSDLGMPPEAKEAVAFALLASECVSGTPANVPSATGARRPVVLGKINL